MDPFQNFNPNSQPGFLDRKQKRYKLNEGFFPEDCFSEDRETALGMDGEIQTRETISLHRMACGHIAGAIGAQEYLGNCAKCGEASICFRCGIHCCRCLSLICKACTHLMDGLPYCPRCRWIERSKRFLVSGFKGLHEFLAKEF